MIHIFYHVANSRFYRRKDTETFVNFYTCFRRRIVEKEITKVYLKQIGSLIKYFRQEENVECMLNICIVGDGEVSLPKNFDDYWEMN